MKLEILKKLTSSGNIQIWNISVEPPSDIIIEFGQEGGKMQRSSERIKAGKNIGKSNETTPFEQACLEATSRWNKKKDSGYFIDGHFTGLEMFSPTSLLPMLAQSYDKHSKKIVWPAYSQPKFDGIRCVAARIGTKNKVQLLSRKGKEFKSLPHLNQQLDAILPQQNCEFCLDGELYIHGERFNDIVSKIKRDDIHPLSKEVEYHIYDIFVPAWPEWTYEERLDKLKALNLNFTDSLKLVDTTEVEDERALLQQHSSKVILGYEGVMVRNKAGLYYNDKRSYDLQKVKSFITDEFEIVGAEENRGRQAGQCTVICKTKDGQEFGVKPEGTEQEREWYWDHKDEIVGQLLTVRYFELSSDGIPRFPIGVGVRDYE